MIDGEGLSVRQAVERCNVAPPAIGSMKPQRNRVSPGFRAAE